MGYNEEDWLMISGLQHFSFCRRRWALIHLEQQWDENRLTTEGELIHKKVHDPTQNETRGDLRIVRGLSVHSAELGLSGQCDAVEFRKSEKGVPLQGRRGLWIPYPVEYKHGNGSSEEADSLQLAAQALCLEEMLVCKVSSAAIYYYEIRHRHEIPITEELRETVRSMSAEMHRYFREGRTPKAVKKPHCRSCSLKDLCLPTLEKKRPNIYIENRIHED